MAPALIASISALAIPPVILFAGVVAYIAVRRDTVRFLRVQDHARHLSEVGVPQEDVDAVARREMAA